MHKCCAFGLLLWFCVPPEIEMRCYNTIITIVWPCCLSPLMRYNGVKSALWYEAMRPFVIWLIANNFFNGMYPLWNTCSQHAALQMYGVQKKVICIKIFSPGNFTHLVFFQNKCSFYIQSFIRKVILKELSEFLCWAFT